VLSLAGKSALIVGTRRIGAVVAQRLAQEGVNLAISYRHSQKEAERLATIVTPLVERVHLVQGDITVEEDVRRIVQESGDAMDGLWFLVNFASGFPRTPLESLDGQAWDKALAVARGNYLLAVHGARRMAANPGPTRGHLVMFTDWAAAQTPYRGYLPYLTAKASIDFMTRAFAVELAPQGVLVNAVAPGPTMRPADLSEEIWQTEVVRHTPLKRESSAEEIAEIVVTLLKSETITGETIRVDSGRHLAGPGPESEGEE
jgi:pteridine reductase